MTDGVLLPVWIASTAPCTVQKSPDPSEATTQPPSRFFEAPLVLKRHCSGSIPGDAFPAGSVKIPGSMRTQYSCPGEKSPVCTRMTAELPSMITGSKRKGTPPNVFVYVD